MSPDETEARLQALIDTYVQEERAAVVAWLRALAVECRSEGLAPEDYALCEAAQAIEAGVHRERGDL